jgi:hypothetical protein
MGFTTASIVAEQRSEIIQITTGCKELDQILEGAYCVGVCGTRASVRGAWPRAGGLTHVSSSMGVGGLVAARRRQHHV